MLHIACVRAGAWFAPAYVNILHDSVRRNLADGFVGKFICFTDQPDVLDGGVEVRPLPENLPGWWAKLGLHKPGVFPDGDRVLYFDLGCLITGRLDEIASYDGPFAILRDFYRPDGLQSVVMAWEAGTTTDVWERYEATGCPQDFETGQTWGDQAWIEHVRPDAIRLQSVFPDAFVSYKLTQGPPDKASVVCFHGDPKPGDILTGWVPQVWCIGGMSRAELDVVCNVARDRINVNVKDAIERDLGWFDTAPEHGRHVCIVGGGPSLADTLPELKWRKSIGQKVWALNGAARFLYRNGIVPDAVIIADARPENADFLGELNQRTAVYLASQCHPTVFDHAEDYDLDVMLWHADTPGMPELLANETERPVHLIGGGSTVGMNAMVMAFAGGYRKIHLYGFDSSYRNKQHHAYSQPLNDKDRIIDALYRDQKFQTAPWMAQQVTDFQDLAVHLVAEGCIITVAGDGLLPTVARDMEGNIPPTPAMRRASEVLKRLNGAKHPRGAEVGVFAGEMSAALLRENPILHLDMIDSWEGDGQAYQGDSGDWHAKLSQQQQDGYFEAAKQRTEFASVRRTIMRGRSTQAAEHSPHQYDFVFLDADHSYEGCKADIEAWSAKVKPGGWLGGHDYENTSFPKFGVTRAVNEFVAAHGLKLELGDHFCWFIRIHIPSDGKVLQNG
jgi:uncharacterized Rossmann fold enzyme